jgi:hypothetical protein
MSTEARYQPALKRVLHLPALVLPVNGVLAGVTGNIGGADAIHLGLGLKTYRNFNELLANLDIDLVSLCMPTGAPPTIVTAKVGLQAVESCEAEEQSVHSRNIVTWS